VVVSVW